LIVLILAKRSNGGAEVFEFIIQFKRVVMHGDINFGEKFIARASAQTSEIIIRG
jgi:hypothetical protein